MKTKPISDMAQGNQNGVMLPGGKEAHDGSSHSPGLTDESTTLLKVGGASVNVGLLTSLGRRAEGADETLPLLDLADCGSQAVAVIPLLAVVALHHIYVVVPSGLAEAVDLGPVARDLWKYSIQAIVRLPDRSCSLLFRLQIILCQSQYPVFSLLSSQHTCRI